MAEAARAESGALHPRAKIDAPPISTLGPELRRKTMHQSGPELGQPQGRPSSEDELLATDPTQGRL